MYRFGLGDVPPTTGALTGQLAVEWNAIQQMRQGKYSDGTPMGAPNRIPETLGGRPWAFLAGLEHGGLWPNTAEGYGTASAFLAAQSPYGFADRSTLKPIELGADLVANKSPGAAWALWRAALNTLYSNSDPAAGQLVQALQRGITAPAQLTDNAKALEGYTVAIVKAVPQLTQQLHNGKPFGPTPGQQLFDAILGAHLVELVKGRYTVPVPKQPSTAPQGPRSTSYTQPGIQLVIDRNAPPSPGDGINFAVVAWRSIMLGNAVGFGEFQPAGSWTKAAPGQVIRYGQYTERDPVQVYTPDDVYSGTGPNDAYWDKAGLRAVLASSGPGIAPPPAAGARPVTPTMKPIPSGSIPIPDQPGPITDIAVPPSSVNQGSPGGPVQIVTDTGGEGSVVTPGTGIAATPPNAKLWAGVALGAAALVALLFQPRRRKRRRG